MVGLIAGLGMLFIRHILIYAFAALCFEFVFRLKMRMKMENNMAHLMKNLNSIREKILHNSLIFPDITVTNSYMKYFMKWEG